MPSSSSITLTSLSLLSSDESSLESSELSSGSGVGSFLDFLLDFLSFAAATGAGATSFFEAFLPLVAGEAADAFDLEPILISLGMEMV